jgi:hypothetical protein
MSRSNDTSRYNQTINEHITQGHLANNNIIAEAVANFLAQSGIEYKRCKKRRILDCVNSHSVRVL